LIVSPSTILVTVTASWACKGDAGRVRINTNDMIKMCGRYFLICILLIKLIE